MRIIVGEVCFIKQVKNAALSTGTAFLESISVTSEIKSSNGVKIIYATTELTSAMKVAALLHVLGFDPALTFFK